MKDNLKDFVQQHREAFEEPYEDFAADWRAIEANLDQHHSKKQRLWWGRSVAAVVTLLVASALWWQWQVETSSQETEPAFSAEFIETEQYYNRLIEQKMKVIATKQGGISQEVQANMEQLDEVYQELRRDLKDKANNADVVEAMITHHRLKLRVLEQILETIEQQENHEDTHQRL